MTEPSTDPNPEIGQLIMATYAELTGGPLNEIDYSGAIAAILSSTAASNDQAILKAVLSKAVSKLHVPPRAPEHYTEDVTFETPPVRPTTKTFTPARADSVIFEAPDARSGTTRKGRFQRFEGIMRSHPLQWIVMAEGVQASYVSGCRSKYGKLGFEFEHKRMRDANFKVWARYNPKGA